MLETYVEKFNDAYEGRTRLEKTDDEFDFCPEDLFSGDYSDGCTIEQMEIDLYEICTIVENCDFFKNRDAEKVEALSFILRGLTAFAAKNKASMSVFVDLFDDTMHIEILSEVFMLSGELLSMFGFIIMNCTDILFSDKCIMFSYSFSK